MTVVDWLLDSDPSVRWQVMRDLTDARGGGRGSDADPESAGPGMYR